MSEKDFFLFPASQGYSLKHLDKTVRSPLELSELAPLSASERRGLENIYKDGKCWAWGLPPGVSNDEKWKLIVPGTMVGFIVDGLRYFASVTFTTHNQALALNLWEKHPTRGQAFEYVCFLTEPKSVHIATPRLNELLGYNLRGAPQGATRIADESARDLLIEALRDDGVTELPPTAVDDATATTLNITSAEGRSFYRKHRVYERDRKLRRLVLQGGTECQCCGFRFDRSFGPDFAGFAEVHHLKPVSHGIRESTITDFAVLCSNCHTAAHYKTKFPRPIDELRARLGLS